MNDFRILVLEDDEGLLTLLKDVLQEEGYNVDACADSCEAIRLARSNIYDLMIADVRMEGLDGISALTQVQSYQPDVSGIVISGYADPHQEVRAGRLGLGALLKKPFQLDVFLERVNAILHERSAKLEKRQAFQALLDSHRWANEQLTLLLAADPGEDIDYRRLSLVITELGQACGLLGGALEKLRSAALLGAWTRFPSHLPTPSGFPPLEYTEWLSQIDDRWDEVGSLIPLPSRIIAVALEVSQSDIDLNAVERLSPGRFDPEILSALAEIENRTSDWATNTLESSAREPKTSDALLALARTLIQAGDFTHARAALSEAISSGADTLEGVTALLELARLEQRSGFTEEAKSIVRKVPELVTEFGPSTAAGTLLQCGRLLLDLGETEEARTYIHQAQNRFLTLGLFAQAAECVVLSRQGETEPFGNETDLKALKVLLEPRHREKLIPLLDRVIALLLRGLPRQPVLTRPLARLLVAYPRVSARQLELAPAESQSAALAVMEATGRISEVLLAPLVKSLDPQLRARAQRLMTESLDADTLTNMITVRSLGALKVYAGETLISDKTWRTRKVQFLFARLAEAYPHPVSEDKLIEDIWPGEIEKGRNSLYTATSSIRAALKQVGVGVAETVIRVPQGLQIGSSLHVEHDLIHLRQIDQEARSADVGGRPDEALRGYRRIVALAEGAYLPECYLDWAVRIRDEVEQKRLGACLKIVEAAAGQGRYAEVLEYARQAVKIDCCHQESYRNLMQALIALRRPEEALRQYEACKASLWRELQIEPSIAIETLKVKAQLS